MTSAGVYIVHGVNNVAHTLRHGWLVSICCFGYGFMGIASGL
jgi:hypothetical protein